MYPLALCAGSSLGGSGRCTGVGSFTLELATNRFEPPPILILPPSVLAACATTTCCGGAGRI